MNSKVVASKELLQHTHEKAPAAKGNLKRRLGREFNGEATLSPAMLAFLIASINPAGSLVKTAQRQGIGVFESDLCDVASTFCADGKWGIRVPLGLETGARRPMIAWGLAHIELARGGFDFTRGDVLRLKSMVLAKSDARARSVGRSKVNPSGGAASSGTESSGRSPYPRVKPARQISVRQPELTNCKIWSKVRS